MFTGLWCENMADVPKGLESLMRHASGAAGKALPPVQSWNPPHCGDIGLKIDREGRWFYQGSQITRAPLVRLFGSILRKDPEGYVLVTPVEKVSIEVEDAPFLAVELMRRGAGEAQSLALRTTLDEWVEVGPDHPLRFATGGQGFKPYVLVRKGLWALLSRPLAFDLVDLAVQHGPSTGLWSNAMFFPLDGTDGTGLAACNRAD